MTVKCGRISFLRWVPPSIENSGWIDRQSIPRAVVVLAKQTSPYNPIEVRGLLESPRCLFARMEILSKFARKDRSGSFPKPPKGSFPSYTEYEPTPTLPVSGPLPSIVEENSIIQKPSQHQTTSPGAVTPLHAKLLSKLLCRSGDRQDTNTTIMSSDDDMMPLLDFASWNQELMDLEESTSTEEG